MLQGLRTLGMLLRRLSCAGTRSLDRSLDAIPGGAVATVLHPDFKYGRNFTDDVALLHLARPVPFPAVKLGTSSDTLPAGGLVGCRRELELVHGAGVAWRLSAPPASHCVPVPRMPCKLQRPP